MPVSGHTKAGAAHPTHSAAVCALHHPIPPPRAADRLSRAVVESQGPCRGRAALDEGEPPPVALGWSARAVVGGRRRPRRARRGPRRPGCRCAPPQALCRRLGHHVQRAPDHAPRRQLPSAAPAPGHPHPYRALKQTRRRSCIQGDATHVRPWQRGWAPGVVTGALEKSELLVEEPEVAIREAHDDGDAVAARRGPVVQGNEG